MIKFLRFRTALLSSLFLTVFASCNDKYVTTTGNTWGTSYHITYRGEPSLEDSITVMLAHIDRELSMFNPTSTVSRINRRDTMYATPDFRAVFELAKKVSEASGGLYDPTVAPLVEIWGFGRNSIAKTPTASEVEAILPMVGIKDCDITETDSVVFKHPETEFDFSSIAKGYGIDCIGRMLERNGVHDYMIEIGGEVLVYGHNPRGQAWHIQVDAPIVSDSTLHSRLTVIELGPDHEAIATSGNYRNYLTDSHGKRYGHTLSAISGFPSETSTLSVTVKASSCALADALATAGMLIESDSIESVMNRFGAQAIVVVE